MADPAAQAYPPQQDPATQAYPPQEYPPQDQGYPPQQQGYPPQQQGYPPQQQGYPPQQQGYPPQQQGYPPQQQGYPPQQGYETKAAYPPQGQAYPQQGAAPPPYAAGAKVEQQETTNVVVVQQQPAQVYVQPVRRYGTGDHGLIYAILASICVCFCGTWLSWFCTIPAIFISINAQDAEARGDTAVMQSQARTSVILSSTGIFFSVAAWVVYIILIATSGNN